MCTNLHSPNYHPLITAAAKFSAPYVNKLDAYKIIRLMTYQCLAQKSIFNVSLSKLLRFMICWLIKNCAVCPHKLRFFETIPRIARRSWSVCSYLLSPFQHLMNAHCTWDESQTWVKNMTKGYSWPDLYVSVENDLQALEPPLPSKQSVTDTIYFNPILQFQKFGENYGDVETYETQNSHMNASGGKTRRRSPEAKMSTPKIAEPGTVGRCIYFSMGQERTW